MTNKEKEIIEEINIGIDNANPNRVWKGIGDLEDLRFQEGKTQTLEKIKQFIKDKEYIASNKEEDVLKELLSSLEELENNSQTEIYKSEMEKERSTSDTRKGLCKCGHKLNEHYYSWDNILGKKKGKNGNCMLCKCKKYVQEGKQPQPFGSREEKE